MCEKLSSGRGVYKDENENLKFNFLLKKLNSDYLGNGEGQMHLCQRMMSPALKVVQ